MRVPEYEQLTDQKPRNIAELALTFGIYRIEEGTAGHLPTLAPPLTPSDTAAQVRGFYLAEPHATGGRYTWTDGNALLRLPWPDGPTHLVLEVAGGERPAQLGAAQVCASVLPEAMPWSILLDVEGAFTPLGCVTIGEAMQRYTLPLDVTGLTRPATGSLLLRLESTPWVPAQADLRLNDQRPLGVQFGGLTLE
ncbi:MAG: hypothetical protein HC893_07580 [Chloroflexaceae bacterium]|nr:hypothetical protein [Chloroflexaceae bacterium]